MISKYKKINIRNILLGTIIVVVIGGIGIALNTSKSKVGASVNVAEEFIKNIYTVDAVKVAAFKSLGEQAPPGSAIIGEGVPKGSTTPPNAEYTKIAQSLDKNIQPLMTKQGYENIVANQFNTRSTIVCANGNYTSQVTDVIIGKNVYGDNEDTVRYYYEAKLKFIPTDEKAALADVSKGVIELFKENGQWKVSIYTITEYPKLYK